MINAEKARKQTRKLIELANSLPGYETRVITAGRGISATGREYIAWAEEARKYAPDLWDYVEAAAEGRYSDSLKCNAKVFDKKRQEAEELAAYFGGEVDRLTGDTQAEAKQFATYWRKRANVIPELASQYAAGQPRNIKFTAGYKALQSVFK